MRGKQGWGPGKGRGPCIIRHNLPVITIFALRTTVYHLPVCQTARMFCSIMWRVRGVSLGVYNNNPSPELRPLSSTRSSFQYRVRKSFYHRFIINNITISIYLSTGQNFTHGYFDNKLLENDSYCRQDKLWSNRRERAGGGRVLVTHWMCALCWCGDIKAKKLECKKILSAYFWYWFH